MVIPGIAKCFAVLLRLVLTCYKVAVIGNPIEGSPTSEEMQASLPSPRADSAGLKERPWVKPF